MFPLRRGYVFHSITNSRGMGFDGPASDIRIFLDPVPLGSLESRLTAIQTTLQASL